MDDLHTEPSADAPLVANGDQTPAQPAHLASVVPVVERGEQPRRRRRWVLLTTLVPVLLVVLLVIAWAVDTSSGKVGRNVELVRVDIGGLSEDELTGRVGDVATDFATLPVELETPDATYTTTAAAIGLMVDEEETADAALEVGDGTFLLARPFAWARSLFTTRQAPLELQVNAAQVATTAVELQGDDRTPPTEPQVEVVDGSLSVVPGVDGVGLDPTEIARRLPGAAQAAVASDTGVIRLEVEPGPIPPLASDDAAREAATEAEALVSEDLVVATSGEERTITDDRLRSWVRLASNPDGTMTVTLDDAVAAADLRRAFADVDGHPVNATFTLEGGVPVIRPDQPGKVCCEDGSSTAILTVMQGGGPRRAELILVDGEASFTVADAEAWGIEQPVGGSNAWRNGAPTTAGPGFTTYHDAGGARVANIHRMADLVRGAVIPPGGTFSINDHVGERTAEKGFVGAGAIRDGLHVTEIGGGVSQFATTMFNAAYFAGLPIDESQAHSEYFDRYPRGREATMGFPEPDLAFTNDTPYGIMIWTSYTDTSLTVTLYSTPHARGEQTGITEGRSGNCDVVTTTRTITYPDGKTATDQFRATYRPGEGQRC
jgi:vancomycin resistance protein YoaR